MKFVSLFSGIGGLDLGLERAGHECILQVENDPYCQRVLAKHWPDVPRIADVKEVTADDCKGAEAIVGGFPCQPVSVAGKRQAQADPRWLWPWFQSLVASIRPPYVIVENVPGLLSAGMGVVIGDLSTLGYDAEWHRVAAATVGAPHLRWRIFIIAHPRGERVRLERGRVGGSGREDTLLPPRDGPNGPMADADGEPLGRAAIARQERDHWTVEPDVGRVAHGVRARVDRLRALGNAVVPQVAELVGRRLTELDRSL